MHLALCWSFAVPAKEVIKLKISVSEFSYTNLSPISQMRKPRPQEEMHLTGPVGVGGGRGDPGRLDITCEPHRDSHTDRSTGSDDTFINSLHLGS